jgi:hypothetical protein
MSAASNFYITRNIWHPELNPTGYYRSQQEANDALRADTDRPGVPAAAPPEVPQTATYNPATHRAVSVEAIRRMVAAIGQWSPLPLMTLSENEAYRIAYHFAEDCGAPAQKEFVDRELERNRIGTTDKVEQESNLVDINDVVLTYALSSKLESLRSHIMICQTKDCHTCGERAKRFDMVVEQIKAELTPMQDLKKKINMFQNNYMLLASYIDFHEGNGASQKILEKAKPQIRV